MVGVGLTISGILSPVQPYPPLPVNPSPAQRPDRLDQQAGAHGDGVGVAAGHAFSRYVFPTNLR